MQLMTGGEAVIQSLLACGIDTVFGIPGMHNLALYDPLIRTPGIRHYLPRHEQGAVFMADGFFRASGKIAAVFSTTGPGATNCVTATYEAYASSVPVLLMVSQVRSDLIDKGKGAIHDLTNQLGLFSSITAWSERIAAVEDIPQVIVRAMETFRTEHPRPVAVEIPMDVLEQKGEVAIPSGVAFSPPSGDPERVRQAADMLERASRPVIYAGAGVMTADACSVLRDVADDIEMHESTVSRVTTNKYIHTPQGLFELKYFFHSRLDCAQGEAMSSVRVKELIKKKISEEAPSAPYTDEDLASYLLEQGVRIARRTIAKYRKELGIQSSSRRKKMAAFV